MGIGAQSGVEGAGADAQADLDAQEAAEIAEKVCPVVRERTIVARNLTRFPRDVLVRGVFFDGLSHVIAKAKGQAALAEIRRTARVPQTVAFRQYPHRDFYKLYYVAARALYPALPLPDALRVVARQFFPIFQGSIVGRTMSALMGSEPGTFLPILGRAYNLSVTNNEHAPERAGDRRFEWRCRVEGVEWYEETFAGIVEGTAPAGVAPPLVSTLSKEPDGAYARYTFAITW